MDANQPEIVAALRAIGCSVYIASDIGGGCPDLIVGYRGKNYLLEVKNPQTAYGRKGLNENQQRWNQNWRGEPMLVVRTIDEALAVIS